MISQTPTPAPNFVAPFIIKALQLRHATGSSGNAWASKRKRMAKVARRP
jgi:hypothetical protein